MFIERLNKEQIETFLQQNYPTNKGYKFNFYFDYSILDKTPSYHVSIENDITDYIICIRLNDFYATGTGANWRKYLYKIFGKEYEEEYIKYCLKDLK